MDELRELLAKLDAVDWEEKDGFVSGVESQFNRLSEGAEARITQLEAENQRLSEELQATQAANYQLIMAQTAQEEKIEAEEDEVSDEDRDVEKLIKD